MTRYEFEAYQARHRRLRMFARLVLAERAIAERAMMARDAVVDAKVVSFGFYFGCCGVRVGSGCVGQGTRLNLLIGHPGKTEPVDPGFPDGWQRPRPEVIEEKDMLIALLNERDICQAIARGEYEPAGREGAYYALEGVRYWREYLRDRLARLVQADTLSGTADRVVTILGAPCPEPHARHR